MGIERKLKKCSNCGEMKVLWKSNPKLCKNCSMRKDLNESKESPEGYHSFRQSVLYKKDDQSTTENKKSSHREVKPSRTQRKQLEKKLDILFSTVSRLHYADKNGNCKCTTCSREGYYEKDIIQCGHIFSRNFFGVRWDLDNVRPQCLMCNYHYNSNASDIKDVVRKQIGDDKYFELQRKAHIEVHYSIDELEFMIEHFSQMKSELLHKLNK